jgi:integrase
LAETTANLYLKAVSAVVLVAARVESTQRAHALADAFALARRLAMPRRRPRALPDGQVDAMLDACETPAERAFVRLQAVCGLRLGEVLALTREDVELGEQWKIYIHATRSVGERVASNRRKNRDDHVVYLDDQTGVELAWVIDNREAIRPGAGPGTRAGDKFIFPWGSTRVMTLQRKLRGAAERFSSWHELRHTGATAVYEIAGSIGAVQEYLGDRTASAAMCYAAPLRGATACDAQTIADKILQRKKCARVTKMSRLDNALSRDNVDNPVGSAHVFTKQRKYAK